MNDLLLGAIVVTSAIVGLFFLRFWRDTGDRLFAMFAFAFWVLSLNWLALALVDQPETRTWLYLVRLVAFGLILLAIVDKNRAAERQEPERRRRAG
jgi:hypothetical protein